MPSSLTWRLPKATDFNTSSVSGSVTILQEQSSWPASASPHSGVRLAIRLNRSGQFVAKEITLPDKLNVLSMGVRANLLTRSIGMVGRFFGQWFSGRATDLRQQSRRRLRFQAM